MDLLAMRTEVLARGFDFVGTDRIDRWINICYQRINDREAWPFLEEEVAGVAPLTIADVRTVLSVVNTTTDSILYWEDVRALRERDPDMTATGSPTSWWLDGTSLKVHPLNTADTINVRYLEVPPDLSADADVPLWPARYQYIIVDAAVAEAYKDSDNWDAFMALAPIIEGGIEDMRNSLLVPNYDTAAEVTLYGSTDW